MNMFNDVVENLSKEVSKVQERSQEMLQGFNINSQIRDLERKKSKKLKELGELVFDKYHHDKDVSEDEIKEKVSEVVGYVEQIDVLEAELDAANVQRDPNASQSKKAAAKAGYKTSPGFSCVHCGTPASREKKFCPACGGKLHDEDDDDNEPVDVEEAEVDSNGDHSVDAEDEDEKKKEDEDDDDD